LSPASAAGPAPVRVAVTAAVRIAWSLTP